MLDVRCVWRPESYAVRSVRRVLPVLLVLIAAAPEAALAGQWYRCVYTGTTRDACCCPAEARDETPRSELKRTPCCDVLRNEPAAVVARSESRADLADHAPAGMPMALASAAVATRAPRCAPIELRATAPPGARDPVYIRHASLLL